MTCSRRRVAALFDTAEEAFPGVDVVVHAAGALSRGTVADFDLDQLDHAIRINLRGTFIIDQQAARRLRPGVLAVGAKGPFS
ncbi:SDR family oxidoreductase [Streptomyces sp. NPDC058653]|uniref:SDR family oxidoreductase n=1 Tax=Streptomyces sp. NPDC058653 TaxID=3346576 RepID=UPI00365D9FCF